MLNLDLHRHLPKSVKCPEGLHGRKVSPGSGHDCHVTGSSESATPTASMESHLNGMAYRAPRQPSYSCAIAGLGSPESLSTSSRDRANRQRLHRRLRSNTTGSVHIWNCDRFLSDQNSIVTFLPPVTWPTIMHYANILSVDCNLQHRPYTGGSVRQFQRRILERRRILTACAAILDRPGLRDCRDPLLIRSPDLFHVQVHQLLQDCVDGSGPRHVDEPIQKQSGDLHDEPSRFRQSNTRSVCR